MSVAKQYGCTEVRAIHLEYEWIIKNFRHLPHENGKFIASPIFSASENDEVKWRLYLFLQGQNTNDINEVGLFLHLDSQNVQKNKMKTHCEFLIFKSESLNWKKSFIYTYAESGRFGFSKITKTSQLLDSSDSDDSITIHCKIDIPQGLITKPVKQPSQQQSPNPVTFDLQRGQLYEHFSQLFGDTRFCDVTIIVGGEKFMAHKVVLAMRSVVFAAMFEHKEMEENRKNEVKIEDLEPDTVKGMLEFIYTDVVTDLQTLARELLRASDKYQLDRLRTMCEEVLYKTLTIDNAAEILVLSDLYRSEKLKEYVMVFIDCHLLSVLQSEGYKSMVNTYPVLVNELVYSIAVRRDSQSN